MFKALSHHRLLLILTGVTGFFGLLFLLSHLDPFTNDDAFVYYNYARNFVAGRPFAYDVRNIPSEGFTSLLYLFMLVPFEFLHLNMTFVSTVINLGALILIVLLATGLATRSGVLNRAQALTFAGILWALLAVDPHIRVTLNWGLESLLGPLMLLAQATALWAACAQGDNHRARRGLAAFFILLFLNYITRPESMVFIALVGGLMLLTSPIDRRRLIRMSILFGIMFAAYHGLKLVVYGDIFPTGFYRKVGKESGLGYVVDWLLTYLPLLAAAVFLSAASYPLRRWSPPLRQRWIGLLIGVSLLTLLFFIGTAPLVGVGFRFLMTPTITLYILTVLLAIWLAARIAERFAAIRPLAPVLTVTPLLLTSLLMGLGWWGSTAGTDRLNALNVYARARHATETHPYLKLGIWLYTTLPDPQALTLVFGDAGALPYALDSRFIDTNGLTEPAIARLFRLEDGEEKTRRYVEAIINQQPDLVVLAYGSIDPTDGIWDLPVNDHSPFRGHLPLELYRAYRSLQIDYACTVHAYYDLHIGIRMGTPNSAALERALRDYCAHSGYMLAQGLTIRSPGGERVVFPPAP